VCAADNDVSFEIELHSGNICTLANDAFGPLWKLLDRRGQGKQIIILETRRILVDMLFLDKLMLRFSRET
jgi:hypothetical protein